MDNSDNLGKKAERGFRNNLNSSNSDSSREGLTNGNALKSSGGMTNGMGMTNGLTNGMGMTNGLTNGMGMTNGLTNGMGMTNGLTNGLGGSDGHNISLRKFDDEAISPKKLSLVLVLTIVLLIPSIFIAFNYSEPIEELKIDGAFDDIDTLLLMTDDGTISTPSLDIQKYGIITKDERSTYIYTSVKSNWMETNVPSSLYIFFDSDNDKDTGYKLENMGADYLVEIYGWADKIQGNTLKIFSGDDQYDWSSWQSRGNVNAAMFGSQMELTISHISFSLEEDYKALFTTKSEDNLGEICQAQIKEGAGALVVRQDPNDVNGIISGNTVMNLELSAYGYDIEVTSIGLTGLNSASVSGLPATVPAGSSITLNVDVPVNTLTVGSFMGISVSSVICSGSYSITGEELKAYAISAPTEILIDGAFADWNGVSKSTDESDSDNSNIDIIDYASANTTTSALFYMKTDSDGNIFAGGITPYMRNRPESSGSPGESSGSPGESTTPKPLPRKTGEDITRIYVDTQAGGQNTGEIFADYLVEIIGIRGEITSSKLYSLPGKHFVKDISAANGARELEAGVAITDINYTGTIKIYFETTDWQKNGDVTGLITSQPMNVSSRGGTRAVSVSAVVITDGGDTKTSIGVTETYSFSISDGTSDEYGAEFVNISVSGNPGDFSIGTIFTPNTDSSDSDDGSWSNITDGQTYINWTYSHPSGDGNLQNASKLFSFKVTPNTAGTYYWDVALVEITGGSVDHTGASNSPDSGDPTIIIPEFSLQFMPILFMLGIFIVYQRKRREVN